MSECPRFRLRLEKGFSQLQKSEIREPQFGCFRALILEIRWKFWLEEAGAPRNMLERLRTEFWKALRSFLTGPPRMVSEGSILVGGKKNSDLYACRTFC